MDFAQTQPDLNPTNYLGWSKAAEQPAADVSKGVALKGIGDTLSAGLTDADKVMKNYTEELAYNQSKDETDKYTASLSDRLDVLSKPQEQEMPQEVQNGINRIAANHQAKLENESLKTLRDGNIASLASNLRSKFPGYRDQIDQGIRKATGIRNTANEYQDQLVKQLNTIAANVKSEWDKPINEAYAAMNRGQPGMAELIARARKGEMGIDELNLKVQQSNFVHYDLNTKKLQLEAAKGDREYQANLGNEIIKQRTSSLVQTRVDNLMVSDNKGNTFKVTDLLNDFATGKVKPDDEMWGRIGEVTNVMEQGLRREVLAQINRPDDKLGKNPMSGDNYSLSTIAGKDRDASINEGFAYLNSLKQAIHDKDSGPALAAKRANQNVLDNTVYQELRGPMGEYNRIVYAANHMGGPNWASIAVEKAATADAKLAPEERILGKDLENVRFLKYNMRTQSKYNGIDGLTQSFDTAVRNGASTAARSYVANIPTQELLDKNLPPDAKANVVHQAFDPKEEGFLNRIQADTTTADGKPIKGRYGVFADRTTEAMAKSVKEVSKTDASAWNVYQSWVESSFKDILFQPTLAKLNEAQLDPKVRITWDTDKAQLDVLDANGTSLLQARSTGRYIPTGNLPPEVRRTVNYLNQGLGGLHNVYKANGEDFSAVNAHMIRTLQSAGVDFNKIDGKFGNQMIQAILGGNRKLPEKKTDGSSN